MPKEGQKRKRDFPERYEDTPEAQLQSLNARLTRNHHPAEAVRRSMEATIERKAKRKRSKEVPASAAFGRKI